jgi:hypothetical protein
MNPPAFISIQEIIADSLFPSGPAAMFSNEIVKHPWHEEGKNTSMNQRVPRVAKMLALYEDPLWFGGDLGHSGLTMRSLAGYILRCGMGGRSNTPLRSWLALRFEQLPTALIVRRFPFKKRCLSGT